MFDYDKVGLLAIRDEKILLCRKRHTTSLLIVPGGCYEPDETASQCLAREIREELGDVTTGPLEYVGTYSDIAAGEPGAATKTVRVDLYRADLIGEPVAHSEIKELVWFGANDDRAKLSPTLANRIIPDLLARRILTWT